MTRSELFTLMTTGMATVAGSVLVAYVQMLGGGEFAGHLVTASLLSAPAASLVSKVMVPETAQPETAAGAPAVFEHETVNVIDAASQGALAALRLAELERDPIEVTDGERSFAEAVADIRSAAFFGRLQDLDRRMAGASEEELVALVHERQELLKKLHELGSSGGIGFKVSPRYRRHARGPRGRNDAH